MNLTQEQNSIINTTGNIKINAVAGSGKTTTVIEYAKSRPPGSKILYLAFNRSVKMEAEKRFSALGIENVKVETAHSLAYRHVMFGSNYKVRSQSYKIYEVAELLGLQGNGEKHAEFIIANHINKFISYFCNSSKTKVSELNYLDVVFDPKAKGFVTSFNEYILAQTRLLLSKMDKGEIEITHDFYLKKFQLSNPRLNYDYILFDEGQDASAAMLDIFLKQGATKVIVGDTHQQIYGWRYAINSLEQVDYPTYFLSTSFRFNNHIAKLGMSILAWKNHLLKIDPVLINGNGGAKEHRSKAIIARSNLGLLLKAIEYVADKKRMKSLYFEGNISSYTYADDGASLYDVLNLYLEKKHLIRDKLISKMKDMEELEEYVEKTEDSQLGMMIEIVNEYGEEIPELIRKLKDMHVEDGNKDKADMIFSTVHRAKGMEYDSVELANDFISESNLLRIIKETKEEELNPAKLNEEINLLYVAVTRTKNILRIPEELIPDDFEPSPNVYVIRKSKEVLKQIDRKSNQPDKKSFKKNNSNGKAYSLPEVREKHKDAYAAWTKNLDLELTHLFDKGMSLDKLAEHFGRTRGAIGSRIKRLGLG